MKQIIIGTAGHVDHGKTCLIKALTGHDTDRLREEKKRGITIELGFAWLDLPDGGKAGIVDVPGHERFVRNMLAGAGGVDLAMMVIAADEGVMPQTVEHLNILQLLNVRRGLIVITKIDTVDADWLDLIREDIRNQMRGTFLTDAPLLEVSSFTGEGIERLRETLFEQIEQCDARGSDQPFRLAIDRVFSMEGFGTVVTGTVLEGSVRPGDEVMLYPSERRVRVRQIQVHGQGTSLASAGQRAALNLASISAEQVLRGQVLAGPGSMDVGDRLDIAVTMLVDSTYPLESGDRVHVHLGSTETIARVHLFGKSRLEPGERGFARLKTADKVAAKAHDRLVIRFYSPLETIGGGEILDPAPMSLRVKGEQMARALEPLLSGADDERLYYYIHTGSADFQPLSQMLRRAGIGSTFERPEDVIALRTLLQQKRIFQLNRQHVISQDYLEHLATRATRLMQRYHQEYPLRSGMKRESLRTSLLARQPVEVSNRVLDWLLDKGTLTERDGQIALPDFEIVRSDDQSRVQAEILALYLAGGYQPPALDEVKNNWPKREDIDSLISDLLSRRELIRLDAQILLHKQHFDIAQKKAHDLIKSRGRMTLAEFRDDLGTSRKYAVAILDYLDKQKVTVLQGDARVLLKNF